MGLGQTKGKPVNFLNKVVLVTGGGSGLGEACARLVVARGGKAVIADTNAEAGTDVAGELGDAARFVRADVADASDGQAVVDMALSAFGRVDGLVCCAGIGPAQKVIGRDGPHDLDVFDRVIRVNLLGTFNMIRLAAVAMARNAVETNQDRGVIVTTASIAAYDGQVGQAAYAASKSGVIGMTLPIARELSRHGIRIMSIAPGTFETPMLMSLPEHVRDQLGAAVPFPARVGKPEEFAQLVAQIFENRYLNGEVIRLDGAIRMAAR